MLHCTDSTTLEDFSDGILVEGNLSERAGIEEIGTNMDSDQVGFRTFDWSFPSFLSSWNLVRSFWSLQRGTVVVSLPFCEGLSLLVLCFFRKFKTIMFQMTKA